MRTKHLNLLVAGVVFATLSAVSPARAEGDGFRGWGPRLGLTVDPDQIHFGAHADFGQIARQVRFQPSIELGLGDNLSVLALNLDAAYRFRSRWNAWSPYLGGGIGMFFVGSDDRGVFDHSDTQAGLSLLGGIERGLASGSRFFWEAKLGFMDAPEFKTTIGWTFGD